MVKWLRMFKDVSWGAPILCLFAGCGTVENDSNLESIALVNHGRKESLLCVDYDLARLALLELETGRLDYVLDIPSGEQFQRASYGFNSIILLTRPHKGEPLTRITVLDLDSGRISQEVLEFVPTELTFIGEDPSVVFWDGGDSLASISIIGMDLKSVRPYSSGTSTFFADPERHLIGALRYFTGLGPGCRLQWFNSHLEPVGPERVIADGLPCDDFIVPTSMNRGKLLFIRGEQAELYKFDGPSSPLERVAATTIPFSGSGGRVRQVVRSIAPSDSIVLLTSSCVDRCGVKDYDRHKLEGQVVLMRADDLEVVSTAAFGAFDVHTRLYDISERALLTVAAPAQQRMYLFSQPTLEPVGVVRSVRTVFWYPSQTWGLVTVSPSQNVNKLSIVDFQNQEVTAHEISISPRMRPPGTSVRKLARDLSF